MQPSIRRAVKNERLSHSRNIFGAHHGLPFGCTGNCEQGRACDCVPDVQPSEEDRRAQRNFWIVYIAAIAAIIGGGVVFLKHWS